MALIENIQREDLNPMEQAQGFDRLATEFNMTQEQIAATLGISYWTVRTHLRKVFIKFDVANRVELTRALATLGEEDLPCTN